MEKLKLCIAKRKDILKELVLNMPVPPFPSRRELAAVPMDPLFEEYLDNHRELAEQYKYTKWRCDVMRNIRWNWDFGTNSANLLCVELLIKHRSIFLKADRYIRKKKINIEYEKVFICLFKNTDSLLDLIDRFVNINIEIDPSKRTRIESRTHLLKYTISQFRYNMTNYKSERKKEIKLISGNLPCDVSNIILEFIIGW